MRSQLSFKPHPFIRPPSRSRVYLCPFRGQFVRSASREDVAVRAPALTVPPSLRTHVRNGSTSRHHNGPLRPRRGPKGGTNLGSYVQMILQPPKPNLLVGCGSRPWNKAFRLSGRKWPPCSRVSRDASRRRTPQIPKPAGPVIATGVLTVARFVPHGNWRPC